LHKINSGEWQWKLQNAITIKRSLVLIGIKENGIVIAQIIANMLSKIFDGKINLISLSMDKSKPTAISLSEEIDFNDANILLIDDVAN